MKRVCVFCGSNMGARPDYRQAAERLGTVLAERGLGLVYGGAHVGLMGVLAEVVLARGGEVIGVIPASLVAKEVAHVGLADLRIVGSLHERKTLMAELSDGFIALPGGLGTFEEFFEALSWAQLGLHSKPCGLLNVGGFFDALSALVDHAIAERFVRPEYRALIVEAREPEELLARLASYPPPGVEKWFCSPDETE